MKGRNFSATSSAPTCTTRPHFVESFFWRSAQNQVSPELIAKLQKALDEAAQVGKHGGIKNSPG
jgi:hypothetical protein